MGSLFTGVGMLDLGLERALSARVLWQAEIDPYCREVLRRHWPAAHRFTDVREVTSDAAACVDVLCGGFPCQPVSVAGQRLAQADPRWLWPEFARIAKELRPAIVVCENVPGLRTAGLRDVLADLAALGFDAEWTCFRAWDLGAPHLRDRFWLVATDPRRVIVRDEPGWLSRARRPGAPEPGDDGAAGASDASGEHVEAELAEGGGRVKQTLRGVEALALPTPTREGDRNRPGLSERSGMGLRTLERLTDSSSRASSPSLEAGPLAAAGPSIRLREWMMGLPRDWIAVDANGLARLREMASSSRAQKRSARRSASASR